MRTLKIIKKTWPVAGEFRISRSALTEIAVIQVEITDGNHMGRSECRPYARYNETQNSVEAVIETIRSEIEQGISIDALQKVLPAGAARNAVDCALWDLKAKQTKTPVWEILGLPAPSPRPTAFTISLNTPEKMAADAKAAVAYPVLKIKIGESGGIDAAHAILKARPDAKLIIDANEAVAPEEIEHFLEALNDPRIVLIEQPVHANLIANHSLPDHVNIPICADESLHIFEDLAMLHRVGFRAVNVKLDKTGGLTEAVKLMNAAKEMDFIIMAGCMVGSSLAMAPMTILESYADFIDLDGPLLLSDDVENGLKYKGAIMHPATPKLWG